MWWILKSQTTCVTIYRHFMLIVSVEFVVTLNRVDVPLFKKHEQNYLNKRRRWCLPLHTVGSKSASPSSKLSVFNNTFIVLNVSGIFRMYLTSSKQSSILALSATLPAFSRRSGAKQCRPCQRDL